MALRVDFYLLNSADLSARYKTACRIVDKAYRQGERVYIHCGEPTQMENIDGLLWTYQDISFLPHRKLPTEKPVDTPVLLGCSNAIPSALPHTILINLSQTVPEFFTQFQRIIEIVSGEEQARALAREHYRFYRTHECELHSHQLN